MIRLTPTPEDRAEQGKGESAGSRRQGFHGMCHRVNIPSMRTSLWHRLTACLVAFCFVLFSVEAAVADVHDADGSGSTATVQGDGAHLPGGPWNEGTERQGSPDGGHPAHVCHCTHGHTAGSIARRVTVSLAPVHEFTPEMAPTRYPPSRTHQPLIRPPIA